MEISLIRFHAPLSTMSGYPLHLFIHLFIYSCSWSIISHNVEIFPCRPSSSKTDERLVAVYFKRQRTLRHTFTRAIKHNGAGTGTRIEGLQNWIHPASYLQYIPNKKDFLVLPTLIAYILTPWVHSQDDMLSRNCWLLATAKWNLLNLMGDTACVLLHHFL